ncbi:MAG TPA: 2-amino-4-hydroxy-6-hydroxymethyldihydropteridine diphosphokinase [Anaerolineales bacterium]|nr:2-amino-4-hydroxy-6-hydroxymethyldihydropteridine diphosphokinase [Anaerolineales bacterium]
MHQAYLSLGSNIQPEVNLPGAIELLRKYGHILKVSSAWESEAVGSEGPNFLNACVLFLTPLLPIELKEQVTRPIETILGRKRNEDKYAPRTIDIDIILFDNVSCNDKFWNQAFVVIPLAEIHPEYQSPLTQESIIKTATRLRAEVWMETRPKVLSRFNGSSSRS